MWALYVGWYEALFKHLLSVVPQPHWYVMRDGCIQLVKMHSLLHTYSVQIHAHMPPANNSDYTIAVNNDMHITPYLNNANVQAGKMGTQCEKVTFRET